MYQGQRQIGLLAGLSWVHPPCSGCRCGLMHRVCRRARHLRVIQVSMLRIPEVSCLPTYPARSRPIRSVRTRLGIAVGVLRAGPRSARPAWAASPATGHPRTGQLRDGGPVMAARTRWPSGSPMPCRTCSRRSGPAGALCAAGTPAPTNARCTSQVFGRIDPRHWTTRPHSTAAHAHRGRSRWMERCCAARAPPGKPYSRCSPHSTATLTYMQMSGCVSTMDALHTQRESARHLPEYRRATSDSVVMIQFCWGGLVSAPAARLSTSSPRSA